MDVDDTCIGKCLVVIHCGDFSSSNEISIWTDGTDVLQTMETLAHGQHE